MAVMTILNTDTSLTIEDAIRTAAAEFDRQGLVYGHGTADAISEASWLILHALELSPIEQPNYSRMLSRQEITDCNVLLRRRVSERIPAAYLTGTAWFAGLEFKCDPRALVPRSPMAELITHDFFGLIEPERVRTGLDLCTGGGCIAIAMATYLPQATVHASDLSTDALSLAQENVAMHALEERVALFHGSLFAPVQGQYDVILSNPPYVDASDIATMGAEFEHEPMMGLAAGHDGLDLVKQMLREAAGYLTENGVMVVEVGNSAEALAELYPTVPFDWLSFEFGGDGVFAIDRQTLLHFESVF